ncbi:hypothetical protein C8J57DRAFT_1711798 [Mycena rebaudengoi]|nr:hypothetical protein C8J57DRAFT_1711798 [Mycena rebaudengoi]
MIGHRRVVLHLRTFTSPCSHIPALASLLLCLARRRCITWVLLLCASDYRIPYPPSRLPPPPFFLLFNIHSPSSPPTFSYYKVVDIESGRLRVLSSLPELASLDIAPTLLERRDFRSVIWVLVLSPSYSFLFAGAFMALMLLRGASLFFSGCCCPLRSSSLHSTPFGVRPPRFLSPLLLASHSTPYIIFHFIPLFVYSARAAFSSPALPYPALPYPARAPSPARARLRHLPPSMSTLPSMPYCSSFRFRRASFLPCVSSPTPFSVHLSRTASSPASCIPLPTSASSLRLLPPARLLPLPPALRNVLHPYTLPADPIPVVAPTPCVVPLLFVHPSPLRQFRTHPHHCLVRTVHYPFRLPSTQLSPSSSTPTACARAFPRALYSAGITRARSLCSLLCSPHSAPHSRLVRRRSVPSALLPSVAPARPSFVPSSVLPTPSPFHTASLPPFLACEHPLPPCHSPLARAIPIPFTPSCIFIFLHPHSLFAFIFALPPSFSLLFLLPSIFTLPRYLLLPFRLPPTLLAPKLTPLPPAVRPRPRSASYPAQTDEALAAGIALGLGSGLGARECAQAEGREGRWGGGCGGQGAGERDGAERQYGRWGWAGARRGCRRGGWGAEGLEECRCRAEAEARGAYSFGWGR